MSFQEIERKFLVLNTAFIAQAVNKNTIKQGFLSTEPERTVRVRIYGAKGYLTIKGKSNTAGTTRFEWEKEITRTDAEQLLQLCKKPLIEKERYQVPVGNHVFEVDVFLGDNAGLILAEVELEYENQTFTKPNWLGKEVTGQTKYYNAAMVQNPFKNW